MLMNIRLTDFSIFIWIWRKYEKGRDLNWFSGRYGIS